MSSPLSLSVEETDSLDVIDDSGWLQSNIDFETKSESNFSVGKSISRKNRGRPRKDDSFVYVTIGLRPIQWAWLQLWFPNGSPSDCVRSLLDRALKFWPAGPYKFRGGFR